jgi:hypothetical protein
MNRDHEAGSAAVRWQVGIAADDAGVFRAVSLAEAVDAARIVSRDASVGAFRQAALVGIVLDLMPGHLRPTREAIGERLSCSVGIVERRELAWELADQQTRFDLVARAIRLVLLLRAADRY